jgi:hypothetical protein
MARDYWVFNAEQVDGFQAEEVKVSRTERIEHAEAFFRSLALNILPGENAAFLILGVAFIALGLLFTLAGRLPFKLGRLPGDIYVHGRNSTFFFPLTTCILISAVLSLAMWLLRR